jgi:hypothetical protein
MPCARVVEHYRKVLRALDQREKARPVALKSRVREEGALVLRQSHLEAAHAIGVCRGHLYKHSECIRERLIADEVRAGTCLGCQEPPVSLITRRDIKRVRRALRYLACHAQNESAQMELSSNIVLNAARSTSMSHTMAAARFRNECLG